MLSVSSTVSAQESTPTLSSEQQVTDTEQSASENSDAEEKDLQKRKLEIGIILTAGIFLVGLFLVAVTLIYGRRTRRQIAMNRGPSQVRDELWYLKHAKDPSNEDESDETQEDTK